MILGLNIMREELSFHALRRLDIIAAIRSGDAKSTPSLASAYELMTAHGGTTHNEALDRISLFVGSNRYLHARKRGCAGTLEGQRQSEKGTAATRELFPADLDLSPVGKWLRKSWKPIDVEGARFG